MGFCKYFGNEYDPNKKKHLNEIFLNDKMEKYVIKREENESKAKGLDIRLLPINHEDRVCSN